MNKRFAEAACTALLCTTCYIFCSTHDVDAALTRKGAKLRLAYRVLSIDSTHPKLSHEQEDNLRLI